MSAPHYETCGHRPIHLLLLILGTTLSMWPRGRAAEVHAVPVLLAPTAQHPSLPHSELPLRE